MLISGVVIQEKEVSHGEHAGFYATSRSILWSGLIAVLGGQEALRQDNHMDRKSMIYIARGLRKALLDIAPRHLLPTVVVSSTFSPETLRTLVEIPYESWRRQ